MDTLIRRRAYLLGSMIYKDVRMRS